MGLWSMAALLGAGACGGQVTRSTSHESSGEGANSSAQGGSKATGSFGDADTALGECIEGPVEGSGEATSCAWVAAGRCYDEREMACNCVCPRSRDSQCVSGFERGPKGHVAVDCF